MRRLKELSTVATLLAVLVLPFSMMGCADEATAPDGAVEQPADTDLDSDLGTPEGGTSLNE